MTNIPASSPFAFSGKTVNCYFGASFRDIESIIDAKHVLYLTDKNVFKAHRSLFPKDRTIVVSPGEKAKNLDTVSNIVEELLKHKADRQTFLVGVGGGVVTDIVGFAASVYMRGIRFAFVPTSILAMVDACMGGKNGVDFGIYKNLVGVIRHPEFLLYDFSLLETLPNDEWINGFAEIIKHAAIKDGQMFQTLEKSTLKSFKKNKQELSNLIIRNVQLKYDVVAGDEFETGERKLLNFGHTIGHAIENTVKLPHGFAISIGMVLAAKISEAIAGLPSSEAHRLVGLLKKYKLPVKRSFNRDRAWKTLLHDKKMSGDHINFIVLHQIGQAAVHAIHTEKLHHIYKSINQ